MLSVHFERKSQTSALNDRIDRRSGAVHSVGHSHQKSIQRLGRVAGEPSLTPPLRIAVIGCGLAARQLHIPALNALPGIEVVGLCDRDPDAIAETASLISNVTVQNDDAEALLAECKADVALILTPTPSHEGLTIKALEAGAHVLVEKPFAETTAAAERMRGAAERAGRKLSVVHNELFTPGAQALRERVATGQIGELQSVEYLTSSRNQTYVPHEWYFKARGGRLGETLPHALCLIDEWIPDLVVRSVQTAHLDKAILPDWGTRDLVRVDDLRVEFATPNGHQLGSLWYSLNSWLPTTVIVTGQKGHLAAQPFGGVHEFSTKPPPISEAIRALAERIQLGVHRRLRRGRGQDRIEDSSHFAQLAHFVAAVRGETELRADADSAVRVTRHWETIVDALEAASPNPTNEG